MEANGSPRTVFILEEEGAAGALDDSLGHDGDAVPQEVGLVHEVGGEHHGPSGPLTL